LTLSARALDWPQPLARLNTGTVGFVLSLNRFRDQSQTVGLMRIKATPPGGA
jgi:hypothetical protein